MAPTLQDVSFLLGLPLAGQPIGPLQTPENWEHEMSLRFQGVNPHAGVFMSEHHGPKLEWLMDFQVCSIFAHVLFTELFPAYRLIQFLF